MGHLQEGTLQAYLDHELAMDERADAAEHLLLCGPCREDVDALQRANASLTAALHLVDVAPPTDRAHRIARGGRPRFRGGSLLRVGVLVLCVAAVATASAPGSPIREWIAEVIRPAPPATDGVPAPGSAAPSAPVAEPSGPAGVAIPGAGHLEIVLSGFTDGAIRVVRTRGDVVSVSASGTEADPSFRMEADRVEVVGGSGGEVLVEVPRGVTGRLLVDGRTYAEIGPESMTTPVPGEQVEDGVVWP